MSIKVRVRLNKKVHKAMPSIDLIKEKCSFMQSSTEQLARDSFSFMSLTTPTMEVSNADTMAKQNIARGRITGYQNTIRDVIDFVTSNDKPNQEKGSSIHSQAVKSWEWAVENKKIINSQEFYNRWQQQGMTHGGENTIVFNESKQTVIKANDLGYHKGSMVDFLDRIRASNTYFPSTAYSLTGFMESGEKVIPVIEQDFIQEAKDVKLSHNTIANELMRRGFLSVNKEAGLWLTPDREYIVGDMGPNNVIMDTDANFRFIDAMFIPATEDNLYEYGIDANTKI